MSHRERGLGRPAPREPQDALAGTKEVPPDPERGSEIAETARSAPVLLCAACAQSGDTLRSDVHWAVVARGGPSDLLSGDAQAAWGPPRQ